MRTTAYIMSVISIVFHVVKASSFPLWFLVTPGLTGLKRNTLKQNGKTKTLRKFIPSKPFKGHSSYINFAFYYYKYISRLYFQLNWYSNYISFILIPGLYANRILQLIITYKSVYCNAYHNLSFILRDN